MAKMTLVIKEGRNGTNVEIMSTLQSMVEPTGKYSPENCIARFRKLMLSHSYIYYHCGENAISDHEWQRWAYMLMVLQDSFPDACTQGFYDEAFVNWDGSSGYDLPVDDEIRGWAEKDFRIYRQAQLVHPEG
ncbi:hypothetical protein pEaSNUABM9_00238 [Erwinia phage pEa_SNUABM_9]|nr:hypothetical protein pEaSNUABM9_00238 [Erwinia phage pEa_SNUABM_9]